MLKCKNCSTEFNGNYCPNCGQKYIDKRFVLKDSLRWAFFSIFNFDKGFLYTSKLMVTSPGKVIGEFLDGITIRYAHPFRFVFIWSTISAIMAVYFGTFEDTSVAMNEAMGIPENQMKAGKNMMDTMKQYMSFITMAMIPLISLGSALLFKSKKFTYAEHLILNSYIQSSVVIVTLPVVVSYYFYHEIGVIGYINFFVGAIIYSRAYSQVFKSNIIVSFLKYLVVFLINITLFIIVIIGVSLVISLAAHFLGFENPFKPT